MAYVLSARQGFTFDDAPAIVITAYSARFGRHGLSIMHCKRADRAARLRAGSGDANFVMNFGRSVTPPPAPACTTYFDLLGAVQGLASFANANWHEPMAHFLYRVREFATANMGADPANTPCRVERTLHERRRSNFAPCRGHWRSQSSPTHPPLPRPSRPVARLWARPLVNREAEMRRTVPEASRQSSAVLSRATRPATRLA
ncbi:hypothetical protein PF003_g18933 [Phytophthora fragariae]|nr:hypothetical protein PF003_g18933 [Phytophthora fragariae]